MPYVYMLRCSDDSYYTGSTHDLNLRLEQHQTGFFKGYTESRLPVTLVWYAVLATTDEAFQRERQIKGWSRAKKEALIRGDWDGIHDVVTTERKERERAKHAKQQG